MGIFTRISGDIGVIAINEIRDILKNNQRKGLKRGRILRFTIRQHSV